MNSIMQQHIGNMHRAVGANGDYGKYSYILTSDDLLKSYYDSKKDLPYSLRKETKRDRYIYNSDGLQKDLIDMVNEEIQKAEKEFIEMVSSDLVNAIYAQIDGAVGAVAASTNVNTSKAASTFSKALAKGLVGGFSRIINNMMGNDTRERKH
jgi:hypothetical protein